MLRYVMAATALRAFSVNGLTRLAYRRLGNRVGGRRRGAGIPPWYIARADANLRYIERFGGIADGHRALELGTGWIHWEALYARLFHDVEVTLFDVWDNRQFAGFLTYCRELRARLRAEVDRPADRIARAEALLDRVLACPSFDAAYAILGFRYHIDPTGSLRALGDRTVDLVFSSDVMEHIPARAIPALVADMKRVLRPGGLSSHLIVEDDHLTIYDGAVHSKNYLRYSDRTWTLWFQNEVQYFNRWQPSEFAAAFRAGGFTILGEEVVVRADTAGLPIAPRFRGYAKDDLDACVTRLAARA